MCVIVFQTDTASVLSEAIEYIKFLHEQVSVSSINLHLVQLFNIKITHISFFHTNNNVKS